MKKIKVRVGWAESAKLLADAGEGGLVWPEFANEGDARLEWPIDMRAGSKEMSS